MRVLVVGATGTIGRAVVDGLGSEHDVIRASRTNAEVRVDVTDIASIKSMFQHIGPFDALVSTVGTAGMGMLHSLQDQDFTDGWVTKIMAQVNLARFSFPTMRDAGSITLSSGVLSKEPMVGFSAIALANGAIDAFCRSAALDMPRNVRINCVSPVFVTESLEAAGLSDFSGYPVQSARETAIAYIKAVTGTMNGQDIDPR